MACWFKKELETQNPDSKIPFNYFGPIRVTNEINPTSIGDMIDAIWEGKNCLSWWLWSIIRILNNINSTIINKTIFNDNS